MQKLLEYIIKGILGGKEKFEIIEEEVDGRINYMIKTDPKNIGLLIGKGGKMISAIRNIVKVRATLDKKAVSVNIAEA